MVSNKFLLSVPDTVCVKTGKMLVRPFRAEPERQITTYGHTYKVWTISSAQTGRTFFTDAELTTSHHNEFMSSPQ